MTKTDLVNAICQQADFNKRDASEILDELLSIIKGTLEAEQEVKITGFGRFEVKSKQERRGRNPQTGEQLVIGSRNIVTFRPSAILKDKINEQTLPGVGC